jgi:hypothetical protein
MIQSMVHGPSIQDGSAPSPFAALLLTFRYLALVSFDDFLRLYRHSRRAVMYTYANCVRLSGSFVFRTFICLQTLNFKVRLPQEHTFGFSPFSGGGRIFGIDVHQISSWLCELALHFSPLISSESLDTGFLDSSRSKSTLCGASTQIQQLLERTTHNTL